MLDALSLELMAKSHPFKPISLLSGIEKEEDPTMVYIRSLCENLGLFMASEPSPLRHVWSVQRQSITSLQTLPTKLSHAGRYNWAGSPDERPPKWLWDSREFRTVEANETILAEGYIAVSYTWGRWMCGKTKISGTEWHVPQVDCNFKLSTLQQILSEIPYCRYFWLDVLCIDQDDCEAKKEEIAKQGAIFARARGVLAYFWTIENADHLAQALCDLGDFVLQSIEICSVEDRRRSEYTPQGVQNYNSHAVDLQNEPWFSSLWTLQEMILFPSSIWMAADGGICTVNGKVATT